MHKEWIIAIIVAAIVFIVCILLLIFMLKKKKPHRIKLDQNFIQMLVTALGGIENIMDTDVENGRLKVTVSDLELTNLEEIKKMGSSGVFITKNVIKMLFSYDAVLIHKSLQQLKKDKISI